MLTIRRLKLKGRLPIPLLGLAKYQVYLLFLYLKYLGVGGLCYNQRLREKQKDKVLIK